MHESHSINAATVAGYWLDQAISDLDTRFGEGFAAKHPDLVAALMNAAGRAALASAVREIGDALDGTFDARLRDITNALCE